MHEEDGEEEKQDGRLPYVDGLLEKIKNTIFSQFEPVHRFEQGTILLSTAEIFQKLQSLYPTPQYGMEEVAQWLHEKGFQFFDSGEMRFEWMLKPAT